jgi:hypothetical protein
MSRISNFSAGYFSFSRELKRAGKFSASFRSGIMTEKVCFGLKFFPQKPALLRSHRAERALPGHIAL